MIVMSAEAFKHNTRKIVYNHISANPGASFTTIMKIFNLSEGTLRYHLRYLESSGEIRSRLEGNNRCYYPVQNMIFDHTADTELEVLKLNNTQSVLVDTIRRYPGLTQKDLMYKTGLNRITITYNLRKLLEFGVVRKEPDGKFVKYYYISNSELRRRILQQFIHKFINYEMDEQAFLAVKDKLDGFE